MPVLVKTFTIREGLGAVSCPIEAKLREMGLTLPEEPTPGGTYVPGVFSNNTLWVSGQTAKFDGKRRWVGKVGATLTLEEGYQSARDATLNSLAIIKMYAGSLDKIRQVLKVNGYVNSAPGFQQQSQCINGASDLLVKLFGERGRHARTSVGVAELPGGSSVEIEMVVELEG